MEGWLADSSWPTWEGAVKGGVNERKESVGTAGEAFQLSLNRLECVVKPFAARIVLLPRFPRAVASQNADGWYDADKCLT